MARRASSPRWGATRNCKAATAKIDPHSLDFLSSHPATPERVRNAQLNARQYVAPGPGNRDKEGYLEGLDGLIFGEDPSEGFVRGRKFLHPKLGFTFTAPEGYSLDNTAQAVFGVKDGGEQALRLDVVRVPADQRLPEYLLSGWIENIDAQSVEEITVNGFKAATASAKGDQWWFRLYAVRFGSEVYRFIFAAKAKSAEFDRASRDTLGSFRRMSRAEADAARPLRLRSVTVGPNDTVERLAGRMQVGDRATERFRVLNGLDPGDKVKARRPGEDRRRNKKKPGLSAGLLNIFRERSDYAASSSTSGVSSPALAGPRRGPLASAASISFTASVSVMCCTAEISRESRSSAAS